MGDKMNEYNKRLSLCIDEKLIQYAMYNAKSLYNIEILYHHFLTDTIHKNIIPQEHYSKVQVMAYYKTIEEMSK